ncbi:unnamed protein product [Sphagnum balticum]
MATHKHAKKDKPTEKEAVPATVVATNATNATQAVPTPKEPTQPVKATVVSADATTTQQETKTTMSDTISLYEYSVDLADAVQPEPLPSREYPATIEAASLVRTKQGSGPLMLVLQCRVSPDSYPADFTDGDPDGTVFTWYAIVVDDTPAGRWRMKKFKAACGLALSATLDPYEFVGLSVNVLTTIEEYEGEKRAKIARLVGLA